MNVHKKKKEKKKALKILYKTNLLVCVFFPLIQEQILVLLQKKMVGGVHSLFGGETGEKARQKIVMVRMV